MLKELKKYICVSVIIACGLCGMQLPAQETFTLEEAVDFAFERSEQLQLDRLDIEDAYGRIREYWTQGIPSLYLNGNFQHSLIIPAQLLPAEFLGGAPGEYMEIRFGLKNMLSGTLEFNTLLFSGSFLVGLKGQELFKTLSVKKLDVTKAEIKDKIYKAYINVLLTQKMLEVLDGNMAVVQQSLDQATKSYEAGFQEKLQVDRIELSYRNLETEIESMRSSHFIAKNLLKFQMGYPLNLDIELTDDLTSITEEIRVNKLEGALELDITRRPEWDQLELQEQLNVVNVRSLKASYYPELHGYANYSQMLSRDNLFDSKGPDWIGSSGAGLSLSFPIFDGMVRSAQIQRASVDLAKAGVMKNLFERQVEMQVANNKLLMANARKKLNFAESAMLLAENIYEVTQLKFKEGVESSFELTMAEQELYSTQSTYFNAMYDLFIAYTDLQKSLGTL